MKTKRTEKECRGGSDLSSSRLEFFVGQVRDDLVRTISRGLVGETNPGRIRDAVDAVEACHNRSGLYGCIDTEDVDQGFTRRFDLSLAIENRFGITSQQPTLRNAPVLASGVAGGHSYIQVA